MLAALAVACTATLSAPPQEADAKIFYARNQILSLVFPGADTIKPTDYFLTKDQHSEIEKRARARIDSDLVTIYRATTGDRVLGYAVIDTHVVRTLPETCLTALNADGTVSETHILAFHEPLDYMPPNRWLDLLRDTNGDDELRLNRDIAGVTGSTLSTTAVLESVRRALAMYDVLVQS